MLFRSKEEAAIASSLAAEIYGLDILERNIEDERHNTTRFYVMAPKPQDFDPKTPNLMTTFVFRVRNVPAALYKALGGGWTRPDGRIEDLFPGLTPGALEGSNVDISNEFTNMIVAQRAFQAQPQSPDIADTLGWVYIRKNLSGEAIRVFTDLVKKYPSNPMYRYHYGMALMQRGDRPAAKRELESALKNQPSKSETDKIQELLRQL